MDDRHSVDEVDTTDQWTFCKKDIPSTQVVFFIQVTLVYIVAITCIVNLALGNEPKDLWISLLASSIGYVLPSPSLTVTVNV